MVHHSAITYKIHTFRHEHGAPQRYHTTALSHITHIHLQKQGAQKRYTFFQELRLYLQDVLECMDVKAPALEDMEDQLVDARRCVCVRERAREYVFECECFCVSVSACTERSPGGLGSRPKKMYGERLRDGVEYRLMSPTPRR